MTNNQTDRERACSTPLHERCVRLPHASGCQHQTCPTPNMGRAGQQASAHAHCYCSRYMVWEQDYTRRSSHVCWSGCPRPGAGSDAGAGGGGERRGSLSGTRVPIQTADRPAGNRPGARAAALDGRVSLYEVRWPASESARVPSSSGRLYQEELCIQVCCRERGRGLLMVGGVSWLVPAMTSALPLSLCSSILSLSPQDTPI